MSALLFCSFWGRVWDFLSVRGAGESAQDRLQGRGSPSPALLGGWHPWHVLYTVTSLAPSRACAPAPLPGVCWTSLSICTMATNRKPSLSTYGMQGWASGLLIFGGSSGDVIKQGGYCWDYRGDWGNSWGQGLPERWEPRWEAG